MSQPIKIQINSLEALERLIGGDSELEIEIRNSVVQKFAQKHLKGIAESYASSATNTVKAHIDNYLEKNLGTWQRDGWGGGSTFILNTKTKMALEAVSEQLLKETLQRVVNEKADSKDLDQLVQKYVDTKFNVKINDLVNQKVNDKIAKIAKNLTQ